MTIEVDSKGRPIDQSCRHCGALFTARALKKHLLICLGPPGKCVGDLTGAARARRLKILCEGPKKKKKQRSVFTVGGGAYGLGKSRKH
ncbi:hypothetical protein V466_29265 [Pseudomonas mandelii PD30]|uniref:Uncharacterized protein n=1 Tax=Pseudomonas mandelii PD30 TaxID=1419583 RepID=A0A059KUU0_9PSED|nr:hypothetical protein V466_29265 [Pseudomonas mandelii PD30]